MHRILTTTAVLFWTLCLLGCGIGGPALDYEVPVPEDAGVKAKTVNGKIEIEGVYGALRAESVNGGIQVVGAT